MVLGGVLLIFEISSSIPGSLSWRSRSGMARHSSLCEQEAVSFPEQDGAPAGPQQGQGCAHLVPAVKPGAEQVLFCHVAVAVQMDMPL